MLIRSYIRRYGSVIAAPPAADLTLTLQQTDDQWVPELIDLLSDNPDNAITVTVAGDVTARIWVDSEAVADGESKVFYQNEVCDGYCRAVTSGAALGTGTWTFTYKAGAGETGATVTKTLEWTVQADPRLTYTIGARVWPGYGGFPIHLLPGTATDWAISDQSYTTGNGAFAIWGKSPETDATKRWLAWASTGATGTTNYGSSATRAVGTPTQGEGTYWVDLTNATLGQTKRITFDVDNTILNVRPAPGRDGGENQATLTWVATGLWRYGDTILAEGPTWAATSSDRWVSAPTTGEGGQGAPGGPFVSDSYVPDGNLAQRMHAGWRVIKARTPLITWPTTNTTMHGNQLSGNGYKFYVRFTGFANPLRVSTNTARNWVAIDHVNAASIGFSGGSDANTNLFILDNNLTVWAGILGQDSIIAGNFNRGSPTDDAYQLAYWSAASGKSSFAWNKSTDKGKEVGDHPDHMQLLLTLGGHTTYSALAAGTIIYPPKVYGNVIWRGAGAVLGGENQAVQMYFLTGVRTDLFNVWQIGGNMGVDIDVHGLWFGNADVNSKVRNNTVAYDIGQTGTNEPNGSGSPYINLGGASNGAFDLSYSVAHSLSVDAPHDAPTETDNRYLSTTTSAAYNALFTAPTTTFGVSTTLAEFLAAWEPLDVTGGLLLDGSGNPRTRIQGALGDKTLIDHRRRTISATFWS